jgi:molybdopterin-biosynthesis enzyme MoeA-like protein
LIASDDVPWPTIAIENVYVFPGVPEIFRLKFSVLRAQLNDGMPFVSRAVLTLCDEGEIALQLGEVAARHPELLVGSYPRFRDPLYRLKVTVDGDDEARVARALGEIIAFLPPEKIVRVD